MQAAAIGLNDHRKIRLAKAGYRKIKPLDVAQWHWEDRTWLQDRLAEPFSGSTVVVTHMGPSLQSIPDRYKGHAPSAAFASNLEALVSRSDLWLHGHVHDSMDYVVGKARVICNPPGYPLRDSEGQWFRENPTYDPNLIVEIDTSTPSDRVLLDAAAQRKAFAAQWSNAAQVSTRLRSQSGSDKCASHLRREGRLLGVYVADPVPSYRYPTWQFRPDGQPIEQLAEILRVLHDLGPFQREPDGLRRTTGWGEVEWFLSPHTLLDGATPAYVLCVDPTLVLRAACDEFESQL